MLVAARRLLPFAFLASAAQASAVTLGPLQKSGITDGPGKAFYLTMANPYPTVERFVVNAIGTDDESPQPRVTIFPADTLLGSGARRQLLVIIRNLSPGERYSFRVCAMRQPKPQETIHARVCSTLTARRLASRG
jgi:hypothetical protein